MSLSILLASGNRDKFEEIADFLAPAGIDVVFGPDVAGYGLEIEENGRTYAQNAMKKARAWAETTGIPALSDDSGLEVRALSWDPGLGSARVAPDDAGRVRWLMERMERMPDRVARFVACLALVFPQERQCWVTQGYCWGHIATEPSGEEGFGYDPVFVPSGYCKTFAVMGRDAKSKVSHRAVAAFSMRRMLQTGFCDRMCTRAM